MTSAVQSVRRLIAGRRRTKAVVVAATVGVVVALTASVTAVAVGSDSSTVYYACVKNSDGTIRIVSQGTTCASSEHKIKWNSKGPQGDPGPSHTFQAATDNVPLTTGTLTPVASLSLPAGSYMIDAKSVLNEATGDDTMVCELDGAAGTIDQSFGAMSLTTEGFTQQTLALMGVYVTSSASTVTLSCLDSAGTASAYRNRILATVVGGTTQQSVVHLNGNTGTRA